MVGRIVFASKVLLFGIAFASETILHQLSRIIENIAKAISRENVHRGTNYEISFLSRN